ncbi:MAG: hypothetical protein JNK46_08770 [Methylobacteriaceae bacterium]|nr:hypothetical protein [Methylobacteriaceae bacterium]
MRVPFIAATLLALGVSAASAQWGPPPHPGWGPPPHHRYRPPPPPPPGWGPPPRRAYGPPVRCWWRETPWGPRQVCRRAW